jgi:hypothetical protein
MRPPIRARTADGHPEFCHRRIPQESSKKRSDNHGICHSNWVYNTFPYGLGNRCGKEGTEDVHRGSQNDRFERGKDPCGDHSGNGIGGIVPPIAHIEKDRQKDDDENGFKHI